MREDSLIMAAQLRHLSVRLATILAQDQRSLHLHWSDVELIKHTADTIVSLEQHIQRIVAAVQI